MTSQGLPKIEIHLLLSDLTSNPTRRSWGFFVSRQTSSLYLLHSLQQRRIGGCGSSRFGWSDLGKETLSTHWDDCLHRDMGLWDCMKWAFSFPHEVTNVLLTNGPRSGQHRESV